MILPPLDPDFIIRIVLLLLAMLICALVYRLIAPRRPLDPTQHPAFQELQRELQGLRCDFKRIMSAAAPLPSKLHAALVATMNDPAKDPVERVDAARALQELAQATEKGAELIEVVTALSNEISARFDAADLRRAEKAAAKQAKIISKRKRASLLAGLRRRSILSTPPPQTRKEGAPAPTEKSGPASLPPTPFGTPPEPPSSP